MHSGRYDGTNRDYFFRVRVICMSCLWFVCAGSATIG